MDVCFFIPDEPGFEELLRIDPDHEWQRMRNGQRWMLQTYLRLSKAGLPVRITARPPSDGIVVFHARHHRQLRTALNGHRGVVLVGIRGDRFTKPLADFEVVQNGRWSDGHRRFFIPYWPQPGLRPRDPARGDRVERIAFKGFDENLHGYFKSSDWADWLRRNGFQWSADSMPFTPSEETGVTAGWHDYHEVDTIVACRPDPRHHYERRGHTHKPATKLYNAWHAGVPAILGVEYSYRELRQSPEDYLEIRTPEGAREAVSRLRAEPALYRRMIENGRQRAAHFSHRRITGMWKELLFAEIPRRVSEPGFRLSRRLPIAVRTNTRRIARVLSGRPGR